MEFFFFFFCPFLSVLVAVLLSASVERVSVSRMRDFYVLFGLRSPQLCATWSVHEQNCQTPRVKLSLSPFLLFVYFLLKVSPQEMKTHKYEETRTILASEEICALRLDYHKKDAVNAILITWNKTYLAIY